MRGATRCLRLHGCSLQFLLTRPMRGATRSGSLDVCHNRPFLLTRPMRGATGNNQKSAGRVKNFYSHAPCGARHNSILNVIIAHRFLLTRPMRGATTTTSDASLQLLISTHTPHAGRDSFDAAELIPFFYISTHTPHAGRDLRLLLINLVV